MGSGKRAKAYLHCLACVDSLKGFTEAPTLTIYRIYLIFFNREVINVLHTAL